MRNICIGLLLGLVCLGIAGCGVTGEVENQAYALLMGVDRASDGGIELTVRIPRIGRGAEGDGKSGGEGEPYLTIAAAGGDYSRALENLQWTAARELNLSHLRLLAVSETLAYEEGFPGLIRQIAETRHLYTTAAFVVCEGRARAFLEGQETLLDSHLSSDIDAMLRHYAAHGYIPSATLADLYYATRSCYSDATGIWGFPDPGEQPAAAIIESDEGTLNADTKTASSRQYLGSALFRDGMLVDRLDAEETLGLNLLTRRVDSFGFEANGKTWSLSSLTGPGLSVRIENDSVRIGAKVRLTAADPGDPAAHETAIAQSLIGLIRKCQRLGTDPFGFAERAAAHFPTLQAWQDFDWRSRFGEAEVHVEVRISGPG